MYCIASWTIGHHCTGIIARKERRVSFSTDATRRPQPTDRHSKKGPHDRVREPRNSHQTRSEPEQRGFRKPARPGNLTSAALGWYWYQVFNYWYYDDNNCNIIITVVILFIIIIIVNRFIMIFMFMILIIIIWLFFFNSMYANTTVSSFLL